MTTNEALPQREKKRTTDTAHRADAKGEAPQAEGFTPLEWLKGTGADIADVLITWDRGELAEVPVGTAWEIVRMPRRLGWRTVDCLRAAGATIGPVLHSEKWVDILVPAGSVDGWDMDDATVLGEGESLSAPHPSYMAPQTHHARSWIVPPKGSTLTDGAALYEAFAVVLASSHVDVAR